MMNVLKAIYDVVTNAPAIGLGLIFMIIYTFTDKFVKSTLITGIIAVIYFSITDINLVLYVGAILLGIIALYILARLFEETDNKALAILYFLGMILILFITHKIDPSDSMVYLFFAIPFLLFVILEKLTDSLSFSFIWATRLSGVTFLIYGVNILMNFFTNHGTNIVANIGMLIIKKGLSLI